MRMTKTWLRELMHLGGYRLVRWLVESHPRILMYHRVLPASAGSTDITLEMFQWQLSLLEKHFHVQPLETLIADHRRGRLPPHSVALTFDDGYDDFNTHVVPELVKRGFPATLFVTTDFIDGHQWMWPDILKWALGVTLQQAWVSPAGRRFCLPAQRAAAWHAAADHVMQLSVTDKRGFISQFCRTLGVVVPIRPTPAYAPLTWEDMRRMPALVSIGSHTVSHPVLSRLDATQVSHELICSKRTIEDQLDREVTGFCYPYGMPDHVSQEIFRAVADAGYRYGCVAYPGRHPLRDERAINRYPTSSDPHGFYNTVYGAKYFRL